MVRSAVYEVMFGKIVVSSRFEEVKIVLLREESFWESVPQSSCS